jgi:hypothetical protein
MVLEVKLASRNRKIEIIQEFIMSSVVRTVLGAALLLTGASAAMAQSATPPATNQAVQTGASTAIVASTTPTAASTSAPIVEQPQKPKTKVSDNTDVHGGHDPNSLAGARAFWEAMNPY